MDLGDTMARYRQTDKGHWVTTLHPYDLTDYHWAHSADGSRWRICRDFGRGDRRVVATLTGTPKDALAALREADKELRACIDHS